MDLFQVALELQEFCRSKHWEFCIIGGIALQRWGEPRVTQDVDITLLAGFGDEASYSAPLLERYEGRIANAAEFATQHRVLLLKTSEHIGIDIALGGLPFEQRCVARATEFAFLPGIKLVTCSAEDLIVFKAFANRPKDWVDIDGVLVRQEHTLKWSEIEGELAPLVELKEEPEILIELRKRRALLREK